MPRNTPSPLSFHYCITLNNYDEDEYTKLIEAAEANCRYWIIGKEIGAGGTPHLQGYISLRRRRNLGHVRDLFGSRIHFTIAAGTAYQNRTYCSKDGDFREGGAIPPEPKGKSLSRDELATSFAEHFRRGNTGLSEYSSTFSGTWYFSGHNLLRNAVALERPCARPDIRVLWIHGLPGVGKSRKAHEDMPNAFIKEPRTKWWNGYILEKEVIIDDFAPGGIDINHLLRWFDRYKCMVETKGGMIPLVADNFILTSNFSPEECFTDNMGVVHPQIPALMRRITVLHM